MNFYDECPPQYYNNCKYDYACSNSLSNAPIRLFGINNLNKKYNNNTLSCSNDDITLMQLNMKILLNL